MLYFIITSHLIPITQRFFDSPTPSQTSQSHSQSVAAFFINSSFHVIFYYFKNNMYMKKISKIEWHKKGKSK